VESSGNLALAQKRVKHRSVAGKPSIVQLVNRPKGWWEIAAAFRQRWASGEEGIAGAVYTIGGPCGRHQARNIAINAPDH